MIGGIYLLLLGLKTSIDHKQLFDRIRHQPDIVELHTFDKDYTGNRLINLEKTIEYLKSRGIEVLVHGPLTLSGEAIGGLHFKKKLRAFYHYSATVLSEVAKKFNVNIVIHPNYKRDLRKTYDIPKETLPRDYEAVPEAPLGAQMQVDFGETTQQTNDHRKAKLYCISFVLSHSR